MIKKIALAGVPNCGKTTLWNNSTGKRGKTGNWPGVTTEKLSAPLKNFPGIKLTDLPGTYSLLSENLDEKQTANYLESGEADAVIIVIDGTKPEQSLYFAAEILSLGIPSVIAVNFADELRARNIRVNTEKLSRELSCPIILISAKDKENLDLLFRTANDCLVMPAASLPVLSEHERHKKAEALAKSCFSKAENPLPKHFGFAFAVYCVLIIIFLLTAPVLKNCISVFFEHFTAAICALLAHYKVSNLLLSLVADGIISGFSSAISFLPELAIIFFALSFLEECGFMARFAFSADYFFKKVGLSGKSAIPLLLGFGCTVNAVYAAKSSDSSETQKRTLSALMFIPCSARLPLTVLMCSALFPKFGFFAIIILFAATISVGMLFSFIENHSKGTSFILEIPDFRMPSIFSVLKQMFYRLKTFITKAGAVIVLTSVLIWLLGNFSPYFEPVSLYGESMLAAVGEFLVPFFAPTGIPFEGAVALFCGLFSKESALFALASLCKDIDSIFSAVSAVSFLLFYLLYSPCTACLSVISREFGAKKAIGLFIRQIAVAYFISCSFYQFAVLILNFIR